MGKRNQEIFSIEKRFAINRELTDINAIKYFNRLTALIITHVALSMLLKTASIKHALFN